RPETSDRIGGMSNTEFWRDLKPIENVFRADAREDVYIADAPTDDERYYVPFTETVGSRPLWISPSQNRWADILYAKGPGMVNRHYHPQQVFAYTISGKWGYLEHDWVATAGGFIYEAPGEAHTLRGVGAGRADEGPVQRDRPADLARRERRPLGALRRLRLHRAVPCPLREGRDRSRLCRRPVPLTST